MLVHRSWTSINKWTPIPQKSEDGNRVPLCGWVSTQEQALTVKESYEICKSLKFNVDKIQQYTAGAYRDPDPYKGRHDRNIHDSLMLVQFII